MKELTRKQKQGIIGYLFLSPWLIGFFALTAIPMLASLYFSFSRYDMLTPPRFAGLDNYTKMALDPKFYKSLQVTFTYVGLSVPFVLIFALIVALILQKNRRAVGIYRAIYYLPSLFGGSVAVAILWKELFNKEGVVNQILGNFGIEGISWIATPSTAIYTLILLGIWQFGASMVVFLAALKQIPMTYYEAAMIDGAGKVRRLFYITLPLLTPMVFFNVVMQVISAFQSFTPAYIISNGTGAPLDSTLFYTLYLYLKAFGQFQMGYASALAWILLLIIGAVTGVLFITAKKWVFYE